MIVLAVSAAQGAASSSLAWSSPVLLDHAAPFASFPSLQGVSCPTVSLCLAFDQPGDVVTSTNPTGGTSAWAWNNVAGSNLVSADQYTTAASCPSPSLCVLVAGGNVLTS